MKLSIIIPAYNVEPYIARTLKSLASQTDPRFETIVVDDGSTDRTGEAVRAFIEGGELADCRLVATKNGGVSRARNRGLTEATGDYVLFLDGDDYIAPGLVEEITSASADEPDAVLWKYLKVDERGKTVEDLFSRDPKFPKAMTGTETLGRVFIQRDLKIWTASIAFRRRLLLDNGIAYTPDCINGEDQELIYKALAKSGRVAFIDQVLSYYVQRSSSISYVYNVKKFDFVEAFKRVSDLIGDTPDAELKSISSILLNRYTIENYFYNLRTCLEGSRNRPVRQLLRDIEKQYPGMNAEMLELMKRYKKEHADTMSHMRAFLIMPELYQALLGVKQTASRIKRRVTFKSPEAARG